MSSKSTDLKGFVDIPNVQILISQLRDHLPYVLKLIVDPSYQYSKENHSKEATNDGVLHTYTVTFSSNPLSSGKMDQTSKSSDSLSIEERISQMNGTIKSEMKSRTLSEMSSSMSSNDPPPNQYFNLPSDITQFSSGSSGSSDSSFGTTSLPKYTYSVLNMRTDRSGKFVMMVQVKYILIHRDIQGRRVQSSFNDEFSSDTILEDIIVNFHGSCTGQLSGAKFKPRMSYCIGELNPKNSKPVNECDLKKTLAQLASSAMVVQFILIINNAD